MPSLTHAAPVLLLCPLYVDVNTSSVLFTHTMGATIVMTRYNNQCVRDGPLVHDAEGAWQVARAHMLTDTSSEIVADFGFHEKGLVRANEIVWKNRARWVAPIRSTFASQLDLAMYSLKAEGDAGAFTVRNVRTGVVVGTLKQSCQDVYLNGRRGALKGHAIGWDDGDVWSSLPLDLRVESVDDDYSYDFSAPRSAPPRRDGWWWRALVDWYGTRPRWV